MKLQPDDPRLTGYALGELDEADALAVERAVAADPALRIALREVERTSGFLADALGPARSVQLRPSQRRAVLRASAEPAAASKPSRTPAWRGWLLPLSAAAAVLAAAVIFNQAGPPRLAAPAAVSLLPAPGPGAGLAQVAAGSAVRSQPLVEKSSSTSGGDVFRQRTRQLEQARLPQPKQLPATGDLAGFSSASTLRLPILTGTGSAVWVRRWIVERAELPPRDAVRVEEMINACTLPMRPLGEGLEWGMDVMPCPWRAGHQLLAVAIRAVDAEVTGLELCSHATQARRVLGSYALREDAALPTTLPAGRSQLVMIELAGEGEAGSIEIRDGGGHQFSLAVPSGRAPTKDLRRAALVAAFGLWLRGEEDITADQVKSLLEATRDADPIWQETCQVVEKALKLASTQKF